MTVHVTVGGGLAPVELARNPNVVEPPAGRFPFHAALRAVAAVALWVTVAFQACVTRCPLLNVSVAVHEDVALVVPFFTVTSPWKPSLH
jgi:hypothetical protein